MWQPVDRNIGARYKWLMADYYHEYTASRADSEDYDDDSKVSSSAQRVLLTKWAGQAYRQLEEERKAAERESTENPDTAEKRSIFYRAFLRSGCLIDINGKYDDDIQVHVDLPKGKAFLDHQYPPSESAPPARFAERKRPNQTNAVKRTTLRTKTTSPLKIPMTMKESLSRRVWSCRP